MKAPPCVAFLFFSFSLAISQDGALPELHIEREFKAKEKEQNPQASSNPDEIITVIFAVPPTFLSGTTESGNSSGDPFGDPPEKGSSGIKTSRPTAKTVLQEGGIFFGEGTSAIYNPATSRLLVTQTRDQMDLVHAYVEGFIRIESQISVRFEVYELPALLALQALESAEQFGNHQPERDAIHQLVQEGEAKLVTAISLQTRSGQRSRVEDANRIVTQVGYEIPVNVSNSDDEENASATLTPIPKFEENQWGTIVELDPVLGADEFTMDLNLTFEHHTSPPTVRTSSILIPHSGKREEVEFHEFHAKLITTQVSLTSGSYQVIGNWRPTGKPEWENDDLMHLVFVHGVVQPIYFTGEIELLKTEETEPKTK